VKGQTRRSVADERMTRGEGRDTIRQALASTCGRRAVTRCCLVRDHGRRFACRVMDAGACENQRARGVAADAGGGSCLPNPCGTPQ
jgi:hypothetical protein